MTLNGVTIANACNLRGELPVDSRQAVAESRLQSISYWRLSCVFCSIQLRPRQLSLRL